MIVFWFLYRINQAATWLLRATSLLERWSSLRSRCAASSLRRSSVGDFVVFNLYFFADKLTNHCLHCHVFTKAPLPCEVDDLCNSSTLHIRHAHMFHSSYTYMSIHALCTPDMLCRGVLLEGLPQEGEPGLSQVKVQIFICKNTCRHTRKASQGYHRFY